MLSAIEVLVGEIVEKAATDANYLRMQVSFPLVLGGALPRRKGVIDLKIGAPFDAAERSSIVGLLDGISSEIDGWARRDLEIGPPA